MQKSPHLNAQTCTKVSHCSASMFQQSAHRPCDCPHAHTAVLTSGQRCALMFPGQWAVTSVCVCLCVCAWQLFVCMSMWPCVCVCVCVCWRSALIWQSWSSGWSPVQLIWLDVDPTGLVSSNMLPVSSCSPASTEWTHTQTHAHTQTHTLKRGTR